MQLWLYSHHYEVPQLAEERLGQYWYYNRRRPSLPRFRDMNGRRKGLSRYPLRWIRDWDIERRSFIISFCFLNSLMTQERIVSGLLGNISATSKERSAIIWRNFGSSITWKAWRLTHIHIVKSRRNFARSTTCFLLTGLSISLTIATRLTVSRVGLIGFRLGSLMILCSLRR